MVEGHRDGWLHVKVTERPHKGRANEALRGFLSKRLKIAKSELEILAGVSSRKKRVRIWADPIELKDMLERTL